MHYFAFIPREDGTAPMGTDNKVIIRDFKLERNARKRAKTRLNTDKFVMFRYTNFYDNKTFKLVYNGTVLKNNQIKVD